MDPAGDRGFSQRDDLWNDNLERWAAAASRRDSQDRWDDRERIERDWSAGLESHTNTNERRGFQSRRGPANVPSAPREPPRFYNKAPPIQHSPVYPVVPNFSGFPASPAQRETDQDSYQHDHVMSERGPWIRIVDDDDALFERANRRTGRNGRNEFMPPNHSASGRPALPLSSNGGRREPLSVERMFSDVNADIVDGILNRNDIEREGLGSPQVRNSLSYRNPPSSSSSNSSRASNGSQSSAYFSASSSPYPSTGPTSFYPFSLNTYSPGVSRYHTAVSNFNVPERSDPPASFSVAERSQNEVPRQATSGREVELVLQSFQDVLGNIGRPEPSTSSGQTGTDGNTSLPSSTRARDASNPLELERHLRQIEQADESSHNRRYNLSPNAIADDLEEILPDNALSSPHPDLDEDVTMDRAIRASIQAAEGLAAEFSNAGVPEISPELRQLLRTVQNHTYSLSQTSRRTPSRGPSRHERPVPEVEHRAPGPYEHLPSALRPSPVAVDFRIENGRVVEAHRFNPLTDTTGPPVDALTYLRNRQQALRDGRALQAQLRDGRPQGQNPASVSTMEGWRPPSPPPAPTPPSHSARSSQYPNLNLNDFHDGPFRASMARTMALNRRRAMGQAIAGNRPPPSHSLASRPNRDSERAQPSSRPSRPPYAIPPRNYLDSRSSSRPTPSIGTERDRPPVLRDLDFYNPGTGDNGTSRRRASFSREQPQVSSQYSRDQRELHDFVTRRRPVATLALQVNEPNSRHEDLPLSFTRRGDRDRNDVYRRRNNDGRSSDSWGNIAGDISMGSPDIHQPAHGSRSNRGWGRDSPPLIPTGPPPFSYARHADARPVNGALPPHLQAGTTMQSPHNRARLQADINTELERSREDRLTRVRRHAHARELSRIIGSNDLESAYEGLVRFTAIMEEGGTRRVPQAVIDSLPSGVYSDWATPGESEDCCPICLDDYEQDAPVLRVPACKHWFHKTCLTQWLKRGDTCPVCRAAVRPEQGNGPPTRGFPPVPGPSSSRGGRRFDSDDDEDDFFLPLDLF
ncbi:unnamed protein product [Somion occarium]|uniref:RING-type domain-containing protein n=1 Tax=Somion occarium TaxID=3059160 RepID=A0ABP1DSA6_9APHY